MLKKILYGVLGLLIVTSIAFALGPKVEYPINYISSVEELNVDITDLESFVADKEAKVSNLKPDNHARIIWADSSKTKTKYSLVYLHGFSASQMEGDPIHKEFAQRYGLNLYLSRLADHGRLDSNSFIDLSPGKLIESAQEAVAIGQKLGEKVLIMSCSTGSTLSAYLASNAANNIAAQIMYSPNIDLYDPMAELLLYPWAEEILNQVSGGHYRNVKYGPIPPKFWNKKYHNNGAMVVKHLIDQTMTDKTFKSITQPLFLGYYHKNEEEQDKVVSIERMKEFGDNISTPKEQIVLKAFPNVGFHVMASHVFSKDLDAVRKESYAFAENILGLKPVLNTSTKK